MISLKGLLASKFFKIYGLRSNGLSLAKGVVLEKHVFHGFHQFSNITLYKYSAFNSFCKNKMGILSCHCSTKVSEGSEKNFSNPESDLNNSAEELFQEDEEYMKSVKNQEPELLPRITLFEEISDGDPDVLKKLKILEFEVAVLKEEGNRIPEKMSKSDWLELLNLSSLAAKKQYLYFLRTNELHNLNRMAKEKLLFQQKLKKKLEAGFHYYGLNGHTMFFRIYPKTLSHLLSLRQMLSTQKIIFDCSYQAYMNKKNIKNCAKQIFMSLSAARTHQYPCKIEFCNFDYNDYLGKILPKYVINAQDSFGADIYKESYLDKYPKEKLLYLTPHAPNELTEFRKDYIYIIGAFVDKGSGEKVSLAKAKENNIKMAKFPLNYYLSWKTGTKNFPLNTVTNIMLDMYFYNDWFKALRHIPTRSLNDPRSRRRWKISHQPDSY